MKNLLKRIAGSIFSMIFLATVCGGGAALAADDIAVIDDGDAGFSLSSPIGWFKSAGRGYNADFYMGRGTGTATWSFSVNPGSYRVSITWYNAGSPYNKSFSTAVPVSVISDDTVLASLTLNQRTTPSDRVDLGVGWQDLGVFDVTSSTIQVSLSALRSSYVMADAVRIERVGGTPIMTPTITSVSPLSSPLSGGIPVIILGTEFVSGSRVLFGTSEASQVTFVSDTELIALAPPNDPGVFDITVLTPDGLSSTIEAQFQYVGGRTVDNGDAGFQASSPAITAVGLGFQGDFVYPGGSPLSSTASWTISVGAERPQEVSVTWYCPPAPYNKILSRDVRFDVMDGAEVLGTVKANLQTKPHDFTDQGCSWLRLGNFTFASGEARVILRNNTNLRLVADAIRVEELFPDPGISALLSNTESTLDETSDLFTGSEFQPETAVLFEDVSD